MHLRQHSNDSSDIFSEKFFVCLIAKLLWAKVVRKKNLCWLFGLSSCIYEYITEGIKLDILMQTESLWDWESVSTNNETGLQSVCSLHYWGNEGWWCISWYNCVFYTDTTTTTYIILHSSVSRLSSPIQTSHFQSPQKSEKTGKFIQHNLPLWFRSFEGIIVHEIYI